MGTIQDRLDVLDRKTPFLKVVPGALKCVLEYIPPVSRCAEYVDRHLSLERAVGTNVIVSCTFTRASELFQGLYDAKYIREDGESESISVFQFLAAIRQRTNPRGRDVETYDILMEILTSLEISISSEYWLPFVVSQNAVEQAESSEPVLNLAVKSSAPPRRPIRSRPDQ